MAFIWFASTSEFSASNSSRILRPLLLWLFPHLSDAQFNIIHFSVRKGGHFGEYAVLALLAARAFSTSLQDSLRRACFPACVVLITVYAMVDEYHQSFVPTRRASVYDSMIDVAGGVSTLLLLVLWRIRRDRGHGEVLAGAPSTMPVQDED